MNRKIWKILACLLALCLLAYLVIVDYSIYQEQISPENYMKTKEAGMNDIQKENKETGGDSKENRKTDESISDISMETQKTNQESVTLNEQVSSTDVLLCFDHIHDIIYDTVFPLLKQRNMTGILVLRAGLLPGDYGRISTSECLEMMDAGWVMAIGGSSELDLSQNTEATRSAFSSYLDSYLVAIDNRTGIRPEIFCFDENEYHSEYDNILEEHGITDIRVFSEDKVEQTSNGLNEINGIRIGEAMEESAILEKIRRYTSVMLCTQVSEVPGDDAETEITAEYLSSMIDQIESDENLQILNADTF